MDCTAVSPASPAAQDTSGIIYILTNPAMPGYVKIGRTTNLMQRLTQLNSSSVPLPFVCVHAGTVAHASRVEFVLHTLFAAHRSSLDREFFKMDAALAVDALKLMQHEDATASLPDVVRPRAEPRPEPIRRAFYSTHASPVFIEADESRVIKALKAKGGEIGSQVELGIAIGVSKGEISKMLRNCPNVERIRVDNRYVIRIKDAV